MLHPGITHWEQTVLRGIFRIDVDIDRLSLLVGNKIVKIEDLKDAYNYAWSGKHWGKVCYEYMLCALSVDPKFLPRTGFKC